jgi:hypothetical protein
MKREKSETDGLRVGLTQPLQQVEALRHRLLALHKAIVDAERIVYERVHGRMSAGEFLGVLVQAEEFAWLRPMTAWIIQLDELLEARDGTDSEDASALRRELLTLLRPDPSGDDFQRRYAMLLQSSPDVALAHAALTLAARG